MALAVARPWGGAGRGKMAAGGAAEAQARFGHSVKGLLTEKVTSCGTDVIALTKQVLKGSRSAEVSGGARWGARLDGPEGRGRAGPGRAAPVPTPALPSLLSPPLPSLRLALPLSAPCVPLPVAGPGRQEHGDARGRHPALRRRKLCLSAGAAAVLLGGCCQRLSFSILFSTEFKENGHNNHAPAVPVSMDPWESERSLLLIFLLCNL